MGYVHYYGRFSKVYNTLKKIKRGRKRDTRSKERMLWIRELDMGEVMQILVAARQSAGKQINQAVLPKLNFPRMLPDKGH